ncbi:MAG TPA: T9SS type A sorting domain-containing protein [Bacteroidia bacterium]|nr:T9SS type A sorting domain-containing protein [Bacteroidia bacterium]
MKKILLTVLTSALISFNAFAQVPDFGFENTWGGFGTNPQGWTSANILAGTPPIVKEDAVIWHWGSKSANITTKSIPGLSANTGGLVPDVSGLMLTGSIIPIPTSIKLGFPYSNRKDSLSFYVRYAPVNNDSGFVSVAMTKFNYNGTNKRDTIGLGIAYISGSINQFTLKYAVINYTVPTNVIPDTCVIVVSSSDLINAQVGSSLWIDDLKWGTVNTGITEFLKNEDITIAPNPAKEFITINMGNKTKASQMQILDVNGKIIESFSLNSKIETIGVGHLAKGLYFYTLLDNNNLIMTSGKITINH